MTGGWGLALQVRQERVFTGPTDLKTPNFVGKFHDGTAQSTTAPVTSSIGRSYEPSAYPSGCDALGSDANGKPNYWSV